MSILTRAAGACVLMPAVILGISHYENAHFRVQPYQIHCENLPESFAGMKIVFLTDLHNRCFGRKNEQLIQAIEELSPDLILVGGDMVVGKPGQTTEIAIDLIRKLAKRQLVVCADGNHEYRMKLYTEIYKEQYQEYKQALKESGVYYLSNQTAVVKKGAEHIYITGLTMDRKYYQRGKKTPMEQSYLPGVIGTKKAGFWILLAHNPLYFKEYAAAGADLILSGHNHGGLIRFPKLGGLLSPQMRFFPEYDAGYYQEENSQMIISRGLGTHTFPIRVGNYPEISVITLLNKDRKDGY